jgi:curved DNA-binding protein CbpA
MTLYSYKEYLTNPLPLTIHSVDGEAVPNCYAILGVPRDAADEQLKEAYNLLSKAMAPETLAPEARKAGELRLNEVNAAYDAVKTPKRREKTDTILPNISYLYPRRELSWFEKVKKFLD